MSSKYIIGIFETTTKLFAVMGPFDSQAEVQESLSKKPQFLQKRTKHQVFDLDSPTLQQELIGFLQEQHISPSKIEEIMTAFNESFKDFKHDISNIYILVAFDTGTGMIGILGPFDNKEAAQFARTQADKSFKRMRSQLFHLHSPTLQDELKDFLRKQGFSEKEVDETTENIGQRLYQEFIQKKEEEPARPPDIYVAINLDMNTKPYTMNMLAIKRNKEEAEKKAKEKCHGKHYELLNLADPRVFHQLEEYLYEQGVTQTEVLSIIPAFAMEMHRVLSRINQ